MRIFNKTFVLSAVLFLFLTVKSTSCWEVDMHYGLTKWLAFKAGFSLKDAELIAAGAESADESNVLKATTVMATFACASRSEEASRHVQQHHFPSDGFVPSERKYREVKPGRIDLKNSGNRWVRQEIAVPCFNTIHETILNRFGQSLHPLTDSWSHQGIPGKGFVTCSENLIWAHSEQRGGSRSHDADITHKYVADAVDLAKTVYYFMGEFLKVNPKISSGITRRTPWHQLESKVQRFAKAKTALEKKKWFESHPEVPLDSYTTYPCFLRNTTLEGHNEVCEKKEHQVKKDNQRAEWVLERHANTIEVASFFDHFLTNWIVKGKVEEIVSKSMDIEAIKRGQFEGKQESIKMDNNLWVRTLLLMWFIPDHGLVNELGHGMPDRKGFHTLAYEVAGKRRMEFTNLREAIHFPGTSLPYMIVHLGPTWLHNDSFAAIFQFRHTPRDILFLVADKKAGIYKIVGFFWMVD